MTYFSHFPRLITTSNSKIIIIEDFLRRVGVTAAFRDNVVLLEDYIVSDGETPEAVSNTIYGTPLYHWVLLLVNDIVDYRTEWPISNSQIPALVAWKYKVIETFTATSVYVAISTNIITLTEHDLFTGDEVVYNNGGGTSIGGLTSGNTYYVVKMTANTIKLATTRANAVANTPVVIDLTAVGVGTSHTFTKQGDGEQVHHYYDASIGYIVDQDDSNVNISPVTNYEYETQVNDDKRTIKILNANLIPFFIQEFKTNLGN
jgi:hypothetical protein